MRNAENFYPNFNDSNLKLKKFHLNKFNLDL